MTALSILAIALSIGAIALCVRVDFVHVENLRHVINYIEKVRAEDKDIGRRG